MNNEIIKEKIGLYKTFSTVFWTSGFVLGGGLFQLALDLNNLFKLISFITGSVFEITLFILAIKLMLRCRKMVKEQ